MLLLHVCISFVFFCMASPPQHITTSTKLAESPLPVDLYSDLSPLKSVTSHVSQSFALSSLPPVFMSPRGQNCPNSTMMDSTDPQYCAKNGGSMQAEQSLSPLDYLASNPQDMAHKSSQCLAQNVEICGNESEQSSRMTAGVSVKADRRHSNVFRHLQFGPTILDETPNSSSSSLPEALLPICNVIPSQNEVCTAPSSSGKASTASLLTSLMAESFEPKSNYLYGRSTGVHSRFGLPFSSITRSLSMDSITTPFRSVGNQNVQELRSPGYPFTKVQPLPDSIFLMPAIPENRKRTKDLIDPEGCRTCNCRKSRCLKLYCDCFANGDYCQETCSCENCLNKKDYEDTVLDARQQIETRNPLAFTPKVVNPTARTPIYITGNANLTTPASARHKRGCNCKKSKCLKKYCECYQAGVGCYNACRCENCENPSGRKSGSVHRRIENWEYAPPAAFENQNFSGSTAFENQNFSGSSSSQVPEGKVSSEMNSDIDGFAGSVHRRTENWEYTPPAVAFENQNLSESSSSQISERKVLSEMNSDKMFHNMLEDYPIPGILRKTSNPIKPVKDTSPNLKAVSPPQTRPNSSNPNTSEAARDFR